MSKAFRRPTILEEAYRREIDKLLNVYFASPDLTTLGAFNALLVQYGQARGFLEGFATRLATRMVTHTAAQNARSWREAATQAGRGREIYQMLRASTGGAVGGQIEVLVRENAKLIGSLPRNIARETSKFIQEQQMRGLRTDAIIPMIAPKMKHLQAYQVRRIARTEVAKADTAITRARAQEIDLNWYQWETADDQRVRESHKHMDRVLVNWNEPPDPEKLIHVKSYGSYHAGNSFNCRCVCLPLVSAAEIHFPARIFWRGELHRVSKREFLSLTGALKRIAA